MTFTPTFKGSFIAGIGVWALVWAMIFKLDKIPLVSRMISKERILDWVGDNKSLAILVTEVLNFSLHGISNPDSIAVALGGTLLNAFMIFGIVPIRQRSSDHKTGMELLRRVA